MTFLVLKQRGKGSGSADFVSAHMFPTLTEAQDFIKENTHPNQKYWEVATLVSDGETLETYLEAFV